MLNVPKSKSLLDFYWRGNLEEYVTTMAWSKEGVLAAASAAGEVVLWRNNKQVTYLQEAGDYSIDALAFSVEGEWLAAGGQEGKLRIWQLKPEVKLVSTLENPSKWIDRIVTCPTKPWIAFSIGRYIQIWDVHLQQVITTLDFEASSVLSISWRPHGQELAAVGNQGIKVWKVEQWDEDPTFISTPAASVTVAWSTDGKYLAATGLDFTITVLEWGNPEPWVMRGFPGKIRYLAWSEAFDNKPPVLASASVDGIVAWTKVRDDEEAWEPRLLTGHSGNIQGLAFRPRSLLLASVGDEGWLCLWPKAKRLAQILEGVKKGFSTLAWHPTGKYLATGGENGELLVWRSSTRGQGFG